MNDMVSRPYPLGATLSKTGCNFSIYAPANPKIQLVLFDEDNSYRTVNFPHNYAGVLHTFVQNIQAGQRYGF